MNMKLKLTSAAVMALFLAACGGGGGTTAANQPGGVATGASVTAVDPSTGESVSTVGGESVTGTVYGAPVLGSTVTAYNVNPDGSNGSVIGTSNVTGADGAFSMNLSPTRTAMVRFVAQGGTYSSEADATKQSIDTLELVAPYVNSGLKTFVITPVTHIASRSLAFQAKNKGLTLVDAYKYGWNLAFSLSGSNAPLGTDPRKIVSILSVVPNSTRDSMHSYQDLVTGLEWFGVQYDLPSKTVFRIAAAEGEVGFGPNGVDGAGNPINAGAWVGNTFDESSPKTVDQLMELPNANPALPAFHETFKDVLSVNIIRDVYLDAACKSPGQVAETLVRYPELTGLFGSSAQAGGCQGALIRLNALKAKAISNKRTANMK